MDRLSCVPQAGNEAVRAILHMDVPHIWNGRFFSGALPLYEKQMCAGTRDGLCRCHFRCGIFDRKPFKKEGRLPLELYGMPV